MPLFVVELTRHLTFLAEGESKEAVEKAARELAESPSEIEDWNAPDWELSHVDECKLHASNGPGDPDVVLVDGEFKHPRDVKP
jgi:hypothetical protein